MRCFAKDPSYKPDGQCSKEATKINSIGHNVCDEHFKMSEDLIDRINLIAIKMNKPPFAKGGYN